MIAGFPFATRRDSGERHESIPGTGKDNPGGKYPYLGFRRFLRSYAPGVGPTPGEMPPPLGTPLATAGNARRSIANVQ